MEKEARYKEIIESNKDRIFRICCGYVRDQDERKDVYQEIIINIWRSLDAFRGQSQMSTWIYRIAVNTCLTYVRSETRRRKHIDPEASIAIDRIPQEDHDEREEETHRSIDQLYRCITTLPPVDRALVALYLEDVSSKESADILGITETNVRVKLHRIRKVLKGLLEEEAYGT
jgi:RNA polymerase sigma-70 factor (ECF subfamily)